MINSLFLSQLLIFLQKWNLRVMRIFFMTFWPRRWKFMTGRKSRENYISRLHTLRRIQIYTFYPSFLTWPDSIVQNVPLIDDNSITLKYCKFLRNVTTLFFVLSFIIFTSLCLLLFVYISCSYYYVLITLFPCLITLFSRFGD